jgi:hypothetical protein
MGWLAPPFSEDFARISVAIRHPKRLIKKIEHYILGFAETSG